MNITIVQGAFLPVPPLSGGAVEKLWFELGREFARRGSTVTHVSRVWPGLPQRNVLDGVAYRRVQGFDYPRSKVLAKLMDLIYSMRCFLAIAPSDVIVTNTFFLPLLLSLFARRGIVYVSVHRYPQGQMKLYGKVDRLQCVSTVIANAVREQAPKLSRLVKVVPNYVSTRLGEGEVADTWAQRQHEVIFVGRVHPEKGVELLIRAFAGLAPAARAGWSLRIIGPHETAAGGGGAPFLDAIKEIAARLALPIEWTGPVFDRDELNRAYRRARLFVYPSVAAKGEAFPLAPLEAMAQGCPVVTSDLACFGDFVAPGTNAETFPLGVSDVAAALGAVIGPLLGDDERLRRYSLAGLRTVQGFMLEHVADTFLDDFKALCKP